MSAYLTLIYNNSSTQTLNFLGFWASKPYVWIKHIEQSHICFVEKYLTAYGAFPFLLQHKLLVTSILSLPYLFLLFFSNFPDYYYFLF